MVEPLTLSVALGVVAKQVIAALASQVSKSALATLRGDPASRAFKTALGETLERYAVDERLAISGPLLAQKSILAEPDVAAELAEILRFDREPDFELIADAWYAALPVAPEGVDLAEEAQALVDALRRELRRTEVFRPVFDSQRLDAIADRASETVDRLTAIELSLDRLGSLLDAGFGELVQAFAEAPTDVRSGIRDYSRLIAEKTDGFVGRDAVFSAVDRFIAENPRGYFFIRGDPGIGKTALLAQLCKVAGYVHHFNVRAEGIDRADMFLRNVCAQLIASYRLAFDDVPSDALADAGFLNTVLDAASDELPKHAKVVIVVDALDEADRRSAPAGANVLLVPMSLPYSVYVIATMRREALPLRIDCEQSTLTLEARQESNLADVREYLARQAATPEMHARIAHAGLTADYWVDTMVEKSDGNFIYVRHVLADMAHGDAIAPKGLPTGLTAYYDDHWQRMKGADEEAWFAYRLPVLVALTAARRPVSVDMIARFAGVKQRARVSAVLADWEPFIHASSIEVEGQPVTAYRIYHSSFEEFILAKDEVEHERVGLQQAYDRISDDVWSELFP